MKHMQCTYGSTVPSCNRCEERIEAVYKEAENGTRPGDRNFRLDMKCFDSSRRLRTRDFEAAFNVLSLLTTELGKQVRPAFSNSGISKRKWNQSQESPVKTDVDDHQKKPKR